MTASMLNRIELKEKGDAFFEKLPRCYRVFESSGDDQLG
jgi:hypothetical protein